MTQRPDIVYCNECSRQVGERLFASAPRADVWLLLEYGGAWGNKALPESDLAPELKAHLNGWLDAAPNSKFLFIKQRDGQTNGPRLYVALSRESDPRLYRFDLPDYDALRSLDLSAIVQEDTAYDSCRSDEHLIVVCTNGRRDIACSKYGVPVYNAVAEIDPESTWQCTHMGGHRFAGVLAALPSGVCYGYLDADDAADVVDAVRKNELLVENTRGRSCYDAPAQAADYYLRGITGITTLSGFRLREQTATGDDTWLVRFDVLPEGQTYAVRVRRVMSDFVTYESSRDTEQHHVPQFHLDGYEIDVPAV
jgi:hypothetical protein